jgi:glycogen debranching enzyme
MISEQKLKHQIEKLMIQNRRQCGDHYYTVPSPLSYPFQWFWDSCFHGIIQSYFDTDYAKKELTALTAKQFKNGMIPHMIYWEDPHRFSFPIIAWGKHGTSSITQPPMLAYAVWSIYEKDKDKEFLKTILPAINKLHRYFLRVRDPYNHHLVGLINPDESGEDNSPRFDSALKLKPRQSIDVNYHRRLKLVEKYRLHRFRIKKHMANFCWVRDVPINAILVKNLLIESQIAAELDLKEQSDWAKRQAEHIANAMRKYMLEESGMMMSTMGLNYHHIAIKTWAMFAPMFAEVLTPLEVQKIVDEHLHNKREFNTTYGVPTVAVNEPSFDAEGFWRGPIWISTNWFIYKGLLNYGFKEDANKILQDTLFLIQKHGFREQYNPITGEPMGAENFTWGGLVLDMIADIDKQR